MHRFDPGSTTGHFEAVEGLRVRTFDDEAVVFDPVSWDVHLLNTAALAILELLQEAPRSETEVTNFLSDALQVKEQPHVVDHARQLLEDLLRLGLIHAVGISPVAHR